VNRHGISQNPTRDEVLLLRRLWRADDAENRANIDRARSQILIDENRRLLGERDRLAAEVAALREGREP
jgi:hypothetical protein